ncbi:hypothetical protein BU16DRAFT_562240 [Lophium mytilinum]|uniref:Uncharacterized protein n=1 Tax=Lophium mytilinum TaxID=390894 RepID=A0A6A6QQ25_9PEZI|nr:hypothetical protein BU16DRAFT_562240 [Lophium mytilinum]
MANNQDNFANDSGFPSSTAQNSAAAGSSTSASTHARSTISLGDSRYPQPQTIQPYLNAPLEYQIQLPIPPNPSFQSLRQTPTRHVPFPNPIYVPSITTQPNLTVKIQSLIKVRRDLDWINALALHGSNPFTDKTTADRFKFYYREYNRLRSEVLTDVENLFVQFGAILPGTKIGVPDRVAKDWVKRNYGVILDDSSGDRAMDDRTLLQAAKAAEAAKRLTVVEEAKEMTVEEQAKSFHNPIRELESVVGNRPFSSYENMKGKPIQLRDTDHPRKQWIKLRNWNWRDAARMGGLREEEPLSPKSKKRKAIDDPLKGSSKRKMDEFGQRIYAT